MSNSAFWFGCICATCPRCAPMYPCNCRPVAPRDYQHKAIERLFAAPHGRFILADEMGLGKSRSALEAGHMLLRDDQSILIIAPKYAFGTWEDEIDKWLGEPSLTFTGTAKQRRQVWDKWVLRGSTGPRAVISNVEQIDNILALKKTWTLVIIDEAHTLRHGRNKQSKKRLKAFDKVKMLRDVARYFFLLTGTPMIDGPQDLWALLNLVDPEQFGSYWGFTEQFCHVYKDAEEFGGSTHYMVLGPKDLPGLSRALKPHMLRRKKKDVALELPPKTRQSIVVDLTDTQRSIYQELSEDLVAECDDGSLLMVPSQLALMTRLRQLLVCPRLLGFDEDGVAIDTLVDILNDIPPGERKSIIFVPFAEALPHITKAIHDRVEEPPSIGAIRGGMASGAVPNLVRRFNTDPSGNTLLLASIRVAASWNAQTANRAYFVGYDWTPAMNEQAEDRLHRLGQTNPVFNYYFIHRDTVDEHQMEILNRKTKWTALAASDPRRFLLPSSSKKQEAPQATATGDGKR